MSFVEKMAQALQRFDRRIWPAHRVVISEAMASILEADPLVVADVGAATGVEARWLELKRFIHLLTFEPVERATSGQDDIRSSALSIGLAAERRSAQLRLMKDPDASTLCEPNLEVLDDFHIGDGLRQVGTLGIELDSLDHCLATADAPQPEYLKVDVEGADLDVLRGATQSLDRTILAVRVEVSFLERHKGAPFFAETDAFLRARGFSLFQLSREHWIRRNGIYGYSSEPQLAWGDAVYFINRRTLIHRLSQEGTRAPAILAKFVVLLLSFGAHDYAVELIDAAANAKLLDSGVGADLRRSVLDSVDRSSFFLVRSAAGVAFALGILLLSLPMAGARRRALFYMKQRAGHFFHLLRRMSARGGPNNSCVSE